MSNAEIEIKSPSPLPNAECAWDPYFLNGFWIFVGIVVGVLIELLVALTKGMVRKSRLKKQLAFEFGCNLTLVREWISKLLELQAASAADNPQKFIYFFQTSKTVSIVVRRIASEGLIFDFLDFDDLRKIIDYDPLLSEWGQTELNNMVKAVRERTINKGEGDASIEFWLGRFREIESSLATIQKNIAK